MSSFTKVAGWWRGAAMGLTSFNFILMALDRDDLMLTLWIGMLLFLSSLAYAWGCDQDERRDG